MILRTILWLLTLGALVAAMAVDRTPPDPVHDPHPASPRLFPLLVVSHAGRAPLQGYLSPFDPDNYGAPDQIACYCTEEHEVADYARLLEGALLAENHALEEPVFAPSFVVGAGRYAHFQAPLTLYPTWDVPELSPRGQPRQRQQYDDLEDAATRVADAPVSLEVHPGAIAVASQEKSIPAIQGFWNSYRLGRWPHDPAEAAQEPQVEFHDVRAFCTLGQEEWVRTMVLLAYLRDHCSDATVENVPGGVISMGSPDERAVVREIMHDARLIRLTRALEEGTVAQRLSARRAALGDDDPQLVEFALHDLAMSDFDEELEQFPVDWFNAYPHRAGSAPSAESEIPLLITLGRLPPAEAAVVLARLARTTVEVDYLAFPLAHALTVKSAEIRQAAMAAVLARLPRRGLTELLRGSYQWRWPEAERAVFFQSLVERLREELTHGDAQRAADFTAEAIAANHRPYADLILDAGCVSRLLELGGALVFDAQLGARFRKLGDQVREVRLELLRDSDPEIRRRALEELIKYGFALCDIAMLRGDPFTGDLVERELEEDWRRQQRLKRPPQQSTTE